MNRINKITAGIIFVYISMALVTGCETSITQIVPYSGEWEFTFEDYEISGYTGTYYSINSTVTIPDTGTFCGKLETLLPSYFTGNVTYDGQLSGGFTVFCTDTLSGSISGNFSELMGIGYASGVYTTSFNTNIRTWHAVRK